MGHVQLSNETDQASIFVCALLSSVQVNSLEKDRHTFGCISKKSKLPTQETACVIRLGEQLAFTRQYKTSDTLPGLVHLTCAIQQYQGMWYTFDVCQVQPSTDIRTHTRRARSTFAHFVVIVVQNGADRVQSVHGRNDVRVFDIPHFQQRRIFIVDLQSWNHKSTAFICQTQEANVNLQCCTGLLGVEIRVR